MNVSSAFTPGDLLIASYLLFGIWFGLLLRHIPWRLLATTALWHRWAGGVLVVALLWRLHGGLGAGLDLHLLGATLATLTYGLPLGSLCLFAGAAVACLSGHGDWASLPLNLLVGGLIPALVTVLVRRLAKRHLPPNYFVFLFINCCLAAALGVVVAGCASTALLAVIGSQTLDWLLNDYLPYYILLGFSEAWLSGAAIALMVIWLPGWVSTFDDAIYLHKP